MNSNHGGQYKLWIKLLIRLVSGSPVFKIVEFLVRATNDSLGTRKRNKIGRFIRRGLSPTGSPSEARLCEVLFWKVQRQNSLERGTREAKRKVSQIINAQCGLKQEVGWSYNCQIPIRCRLCNVNCFTGTKILRWRIAYLFSALAVLLSGNRGWALLRPLQSLLTTHKILTNQFPCQDGEWRWSQLVRRAISMDQPETKEPKVLVESWSHYWHRMLLLWVRLGHRYWTLLAWKIECLMPR